VVGYEVVQKAQSGGRLSAIEGAGTAAIGIHVRGREFRGQLRASFQVLDRAKSDESGSATTAQLQQHGYENFKRTIALNYFTFVRILPWDSQIIFLLRHLPLPVSLDCAWRAFTAPKHDYFSAFNWIHALLYNFLTLASWESSRKVVRDPKLLALREPSEGNPSLITDRSGALISQDLANSIIEISAMNLSLRPGSSALKFGAGYGRDAYAILATNPGIKYVIVDIAL
jgi:hypothetical protein